MGLVAASVGRDGPLQSLGRQREVGIAGELAGQEFGGVHHHLGGTGLDCRQDLARAGNHDVAAEDEVGAAGGNPDGVNVFGLFGEADVTEHRAALLREPRHVEHADTAAFEMRGHAKDATDGHNAGAADAGDDNVVGLRNSRQRRIGKHRHLVIGSDAGALLQQGAMHGDERRTEALNAGKIFVTARLIDGALSSPFGFERLYRHAIRFHTTIAAAFANQLVDNHPLVGIGEGVALTAAALFRSAGLIVDHNRNAGNFRQRFLHLHQVVAMVHGERGRPRDIRRLATVNENARSALDCGSSSYRFLALRFAHGRMNQRRGKR